MGLLNSLDSGTHKSVSERIDAAIAQATKTSASAMDIVDGNGQRPSFGPIFMEMLMEKTNPQPPKITFAEEITKRTGPLMIDMLPYIEKPLPVRASYANFLKGKFNPQPRKTTFEANEAIRTGPTLH